MLRPIACFIFLSCFSLVLQAQGIDKKVVKRLNENIQEYWQANDPVFNGNNIPDKWKNSSGVIIAQKTNMLFDKEALAAKLRVFETSRRKIKLLDKDAVKSYSELYFSFSKQIQVFGSSSLDYGFMARVIKANGKVEDLDISTAIEVEKSSDVPDMFRTYIERAHTILERKVYAYSYYKLAVPNLEPGDIIEYAYMVENISDMKGNDYYEFDPVYYLCSREFPVMNQKFEVKTDSKSYVNSKALNGAPEFKEVDEDKWNTYRWEDKDRDKVSDIRWVNEYLALPLVKFQIIFSKDGYNKRLFIGDKGELKQAITPQELAEKVNRMYKDMDYYSGSLQNNINTYIANTILSEVTQELKSIDADKLRDEDYIQKLYYIFRHKYAMGEGTIGSQFFAYIFMQKLQKKDIPCQLVVTTSNNVTNMKDLLFKDELEWLVKVKDKFVYRCTPYSNLYDVRVDCLGNEAYIIELGKNPTAKKITLPETKPDDNKSVFVINTSLDENMQDLKVEVTNGFSGINKEGYSYPALAYTSAYWDDYKIYGGNDPVEDMKKKKKEETQRLIAAQQEENQKKKPEYMKGLLEDDYTNVVKYNEFKLQSDGRSFNSPILKYTEKYQLGDMIKKAGKNLLVSIPGLMGSQLQVKPEERQREYNIDVRYPRSIYWNISFTIPAGYTAEGMEEMNTKVDNEIGSFTSTTKLENNKLTLEIRKIYKQRVVKKEDWNKMLEFVDAAYNFSQKKLVLKKS